MTHRRSSHRGAAKNEYLHEFVEDQPVRYPVAMAAERMIYLSRRSSSCELLPDRPDEVWWHSGHGLVAPCSESLGNFPSDLAESVPYSYKGTPTPIGGSS